MGALGVGPAPQASSPAGPAGGRQWSTRRARAPFLPSPQGRGLLAEKDKPTCLESARKLRTFAPTWMAVGHGRVLKQPLTAMDRAIAALACELERKEPRQAA